MPRNPKKLLTDPPRRPGQRCRCCALPMVARDLTEWAASRRDGGTTTLSAFWERYLVVFYVATPSFGSVRGHVLRCLRLDPVTALPLKPAR